MEPSEVGLAEIRAARERIAGSIVRTPLVRLDVSGLPLPTSRSGAASEIWLKLENLQPIGSFKLRGAGNALAKAPRESLARGVFTASAGNMAQGLAWTARRLGIPCTVIVPDQAPRAKLAAVERLGARIVKLPYERWWQVLVDHGYSQVEGVFVHPVSNADVIAGNGTIGLEIMEDLPDVDAVLVPYGGGGLACGIAAALCVLRPEAQTWACEVETAAPFAASLAAGSPQSIEHRPSFVDGIGGRSQLAEMWPLARKLLAGSFVSTVAEIAAAVRILVERNRVVAEGAGAAGVAAALAGKPRGARIVCVVSGGNIDPERLAKILLGEIP